MNITSDDPRLTAYALDELDEAGQKGGRRTISQPTGGRG